MREKEAQALAHLELGEPGFLTPGQRMHDIIFGWHLIKSGDHFHILGHLHTSGEPHITSPITWMDRSKNRDRVLTYSGHLYGISRQAAPDDDDNMEWPLARHLAVWNSRL